MTGLEASKLIIDRFKLDSAILSKITMKGTMPAIISGIVLPTGWSATDSTIVVSVIAEQSRTDYFKIRLSAVCRSSSYKLSRELAYAVFDELNRVNTTGLSIVANVSPTQEPNGNELSAYVTPVEILVRSS